MQLANKKVKGGGDMFSALDESGTVTWITTGNAARLKQEKKILYCPSCQSKLLIKVGKTKLPHFAHPAHANSCILSGESLLHREGKYRLATYFRLQGCSTELEVYLPNINRQADLLINKNIVFEYQCSSISTRDFLQRTTDYQSQKLKVYWLYGKPLERNKTYLYLTAFGKNFLRYHPRLGLFLFRFDPHSEEWQIFYHLASTFKQTKFRYRQLIFSKGIALTDIFSCLRRIRQPAFYADEGIEAVRQKRIYMYTRFDNRRLFMQFLYQNGYCLQNLPSCIGIITHCQALVQEPALEWQFFLWHTFFQSLREGDTFTTKAYLHAFKQIVHPIRLPMIQEDAYLDLGTAYLNYLTRKKYIQNAEKESYHVLRSFSY